MEDLIHTFRRGISLFESGELTCDEILNKVLLDLSQFKRFDLVPDAVELLPSSMRARLRQVAPEILSAGDEYHGIGMIVLSRPCDERCKNTRVALRRVCELLLPILDRDAKNTSSAPDNT